MSKGGLPITFPKIPPYKTIGNYNLSKAYLGSTQFHKVQWDKSGHDPILHLMASQRILARTEEKLKKRREWAVHEKEKLKAQWENLNTLESKFKKTFVNMNGFVMTNQEKRVRAEQTKEINSELTKKRSQEINVLRSKMAALLDMQTKLEENITKLALYEKYLHKVLDFYDEFKNTDDIISRFEALVTTRNLLGKRQNENLRELETARAKTAKMIEEYRFRTLGLNNIVADLHSRYNVAFREAVHWENIVLGIKSHSYTKFKELNEVKQSCWNLYLLMCKRKNEAPKIQEHEVEKQLLYIKKTLEELEFVQSMVSGGSKQTIRSKLMARKRSNRRWT